jgi:UDP-N-acetylglucosamine 2-epimerase (non-hydrolysing)
MGTEAAINRMRVVSVAGARPNFMKIAPLAEECRRHRDIAHIIVHTGQHYDESMSRVFFDELGIPRPDFNLEVGSQEREAQIRTVMERFEPVVREERPDVVIVVGDVNSTVACARVARRHGVRVAHVEAGLRSFDLSMPEEHNRLETDGLSDYLFVTEQSGMQNLAAEGVRGKAFLVGNVMIDTLVRHLAVAERGRVLETLGVRPAGYITATFHRPNNVDEPDSLGRLIGTLRALCARLPVVFPLHPRTRSRAMSYGLLEALVRMPGLILTEPLGYVDFLGLVRHSRVVVTDSGGIQEETTYLGVPCLTMRENTERPITVEVGSNVLVGGDRDLLLRSVDDVLAGRFKRGRVPELWDGRTARRIVARIRSELGCADA